MEITKATEEHIPAIKSIFADVMARPPYNHNLSEERVEKIIDSYFSHEAVYVALDGEVQGFAVCFSYEWVRGRTLWVAELHVRSESQGRGIGRALLEHVEHAEGVESVELLAHEGAPAMEFYGRVGFTRSPYVKMERECR